MSVLAKTRAKYIAPIDPVELAMVMLEAASNMRRPQGLNAREAIAQLETEDRERWMRAANAAMRYWQECIANANRTQ